MNADKSRCTLDPRQGTAPGETRRGKSGTTCASHKTPSGGNETASGGGETTSGGSGTGHALRATQRFFLPLRASSWAFLTLGSHFRGLSPLLAELLTALVAPGS